MPYNRKSCPNCGKLTRDAPERKIPIVPAIIALAFCAVVIFGAALAIVSHFGAANYGDGALHIGGTWETDGPTYNDELITYVFEGESFSRVIETIIFGASYADIEAREAYEYNYNGAAVYAEDVGEGNFRLRITADGTFWLDGNNIVLVSGEGFMRVFSFYWEDDAIFIDGDRFVRMLR